MKQLLLVLFTVTLFSCNSNKKTYAMIETEFGNMKVELYDSTPEHKENFIKLVNEGFYKDLLFHRVMKEFMAQGGDPDSRGAEAGKRLGMGGPGYTIPAEIGAPHFKGTLAAARTGGPSNPEKRSSGSQFYLVQGKVQTDQDMNNMQSSKGITYNAEQLEKYKTLGGAPFLDMDYTVFGEVVEGMDVIDKICAVQCDAQNRPNADVKMNIRML